ncbi:MAG: hypothetical protein HY521_13575 [Proteobacteria bacterium]|nr:hypothetical protein [Pseudomonadota bacterium]
MALQRFLARLGSAAGLALLISGALPAAPVLAQGVTYSGDVLPILQLRCLECHQPGGEGYEKSGLDLRTYEGLMKGTKFGAIVVPGDAFTSNFIAMVDGRVAPPIRMPHNRNKLTHCEVDIFRRWVNQGARNN